MLAKLGASLSFFLQPVRIIRAYHLSSLRLDLVAGLTVGSLLSGVRYRGNRAQTESLVLRCETGSRRTISAEHLMR